MGLGRVLHWGPLVAIGNSSRATYYVTTLTIQNYLISAIFVKE